MDVSNTELRQRIIESADEYHAIGEAQWERAVEMEPEGEDSVHEFKRIVRAALMFYSRAYLVLDMIETDDAQQLEDLFEIVTESEDAFQDFFQKNDVIEALDEEKNVDFSRIFSVGEAVRAMLLEHSNQLASTLHTRFVE